MNYKYHEYIDEYIEMVESNKVKTCNEIKQLIKLVKEKLKQPNIIIDSDKIYKSVEMVKKYFPYELLPFQKFLFCFVFGVFYDDGSLVYDEFFVMMGRGSGKNGVISAISFNLMTPYHGIKDYNIDIVATSEDQAKTSFEDVFNVIEDNPKKLLKRFYKTKEQITFKKTRSTLRYRTSNAKTKDGGRPGCIIFDEVHAYEDYSTIKVFTSGLGKVKHPRIFYITTDGNVRGGVLDDFKKESKDILNGEIKNSKMFPFIFKMDSIEEVENPELWEKACPRIRYDENLKARMVNEYNNMQSRPSLKIEFLTKRMNLPAEDIATAVAEWENVLATNQPIPDLSGFTCVGGVDYADIRDFCSVGLLFKQGNKRYWIHHTFICHISLQLTKFKFDIELAKQQGLCTIIYDDLIRSEYVVDWFLEQAKKYNIKKVACDTFRASILRDKFKEVGLELTQVRNGTLTHNKLAPLIDEMFATQSIVFGDDMMMRWYVNNVYVDMDQKGNKTYKKIEHIKRKTDGFFALLHALTLDEELVSNTDFKLYDVYTY